MVGSLRFSMTLVQRAFLGKYKANFFLSESFTMVVVYLQLLLSGLIIRDSTWRACSLLESVHAEFLPVGSCQLPE